MRVFYYSHLSLDIQKAGRSRRYVWTVHYRGEARTQEQAVYIQRTFQTEKNERPVFPAVIRLAQLAKEYANV